MQEPCHHQCQTRLRSNPEYPDQHVRRLCRRRDRLHRLRALLPRLKRHPDPLAKRPCPNGHNLHLLRKISCSDRTHQTSVVPLRPVLLHPAVRSPPETHPYGKPVHYPLASGRPHRVAAHQGRIRSEHRPYSENHFPPSTASHPSASAYMHLQKQLRQFGRTSRALPPGIADRS